MVSPVRASNLYLNNIIYHTALSEDYLERENRQRLQDVVNKYRHLSHGNAEFSRWIEKLFHAIEKPVFGTGTVIWRIQLLAEFNQYDKRRQELEDRINNRLARVRKLINLKMGGQECVKFYKLQKTELKNALGLSNSMKDIKFAKNSGSCPKNLHDTNDDEDDYYL